MRVLWLTPELPAAAGGAQHQWHMLTRLVAHGHAPVVVAPVHPDERPAAEALRAAGIDVRAYERPPSRVRETLALMRARPGLIPAALREPLLAWQCDVFWTKLEPLARGALAEGAFDVVNVNHDWAGDWVRRLPLGDTFRVLTAHNLTWAYYRTRARSARGAKRFALGAEARRWRGYDERVFELYDRLVTVSEHDAEVVARMTSTPATAIPAGTDTRALAPQPEPEGGNDPVVVFTGSMRWPPNAEGLRWLLREVWPRVRRRVPEARLFAIGADPPEDARALADDHVEITGRVPDLEPYFARAAVVVIPILSGAGIRLKLLDALAAGRAIVSTTMGAEGAVVRAGEHLVVADDPESFATAVAELLGDPERRRALGAAARRLAEERYEWEALGDRFAALIAERPATSRRLDHVP
ncbi:MAG: glycosyltransferase family 4 protein [Actinomycetota bacterium]|nr:glycosyltransferase family 4 protein [Actinomycetota bacterium]